METRLFDGDFGQTDSQKLREESIVIFPFKLQMLTAGMSASANNWTVRIPVFRDYNSKKGVSS